VAPARRGAAAGGGGRPGARELPARHCQGRKRLGALARPRPGHARSRAASRARPRCAPRSAEHRAARGARIVMRRPKRTARFPLFGYPLPERALTTSTLRGVLMSRFKKSRHARLAAVVLAVGVFASLAGVGYAAGLVPF